LPPSYGHLTRRSLLQRGSVAVGALGVPGLLASCGGDDDGNPKTTGTDASRDISGKVIYADYGGTTREASQAAFYTPFEKETGVPVVPGDVDTSKMRLFAENKRSEWDLANLDGWEVVDFAEKGWLEELPDWVKKTDLVSPEFQKWTVGNYSASLGIAFNVEEGNKPPTSWADFWDTRKFPGKRGVPNFGYVQFEAALLADGVPHEEIYPIDFERATAKLDELRDQILYWDTFGQSMQFLAQGSVGMTMNTNSRTVLFRDQGLPVDFVWDDAILLPWGGNGILKYGPNRDAAFALADFCADPKRQAEFSRLTLYGPTQSAALDLMDDDLLSKLPNSPEHESAAFSLNVPDRAKQNDEIVQRWTEWVS